MSGGLLKYSGLVTKTRAMHGRLLGKDAYMRLSDYETVEEFITFLRESKSYAPTYESHEEIRHRGQVEAVLHNSLYADYQKLYQFASGEQRRGLELIFFRYEVNVLKECLEYAMKGKGEHRLEYLNLFFNHHACYNTLAAAEAKSIPELLNAIAGTQYESLIKRLFSDENMTYAECATQLDIYYYKTVWKLKDRLFDKRMRRIFSEILGTEIDWQNIMWMYRFKRFFDSRPADIYANLIPVVYRLKGAEQKRLLETESIDEFLEVLGHTVYFTEKDAIVRMGDEITYRKIMDRTYGKLCRKYNMSLASVLKYLYDKENEIDILTTILEGIRYQIPSREIRELVIVTAQQQDS